MIVDSTGRKVKIGQPVHMFLIGTFLGKLVDVKDQPLILSPQQHIPPHCIIAVTVTPHIMQDGSVHNLYIVGDPDPKDPLVMEAESRAKIIHHPS